MDYETLMENDPGKLVRKLISEISTKKAVDVRFEFVDNDQWSVVSVYLDEQDNELALRLHTGGSYELYVGYYDKEDELREISKTLNGEQMKDLPKGLQKVMTKVASDEQGLRVPGSVLSVV